jgi:hypothetical protein
MPSTTLAPAKSFFGISARELLSAEAGDGGPPVTVFGQTTRGPITIKAGPELVITEPGADPLRVDEADTDVITANIAGYKKIRFQCPVQETSVPEGTRLALRGLRFLSAEWEYLTDADEGPWLPLHEVATNTDGAILPVFSDWFVVDDAIDIDNLTIEWVVYGGDGTGEVIIGNIYVELSADTRPPTTEIPDPEAPVGGLYADWNPTEGGGATVRAKNLPPGDTSRDLVMGTGTSTPSWAGLNIRMQTLLFENDDYAIRTGMPDLSAGSSVFMYLALTTLGSGTKWLCGVEGAVTTDHHLAISEHPIRTVFARITENSGGAGGTARTATGTTTIGNGTEHTVCFTHDGVNLKLYVDGVLEATTACGPALEGGTRDFILGGGKAPPSDRLTPDDATFSRTIVWTRGITAAEVAETHAEFKAVYGGLP